MIKFRAATIPGDSVPVTLEQDQEDVNIVIDGMTVAYLKGADGTLRLLPILEDDEEEWEFDTTADENGYFYITVKKG